MELWFLQEIMLWFDKPKKDLLEDKKGFDYEETEEIEGSSKA